jgi:hypothetical protein
LEPTIDRNILKLLNLIRRKYVSSASDFQPMDLAQKAHFFTLDTITDIATGVPIGDLEQDVDVYDYLKISADALSIRSVIASVPAVQNFLQIPILAKRIFPNADDKDGLGKVIGYICHGAAAFGFRS